MKNKIISGCVIILCVISFPTALFAEKIVLKSGKELEGRVIERPDNIPDDFIIVDWQGQRLTLSLTDIQSIDGQAPAVPQWKIWYVSVERYIWDVDTMIGEDAGFLRYFSSCLQAEILRGNLKEADIVYIMGKHKLADITRGLEALHPKEELRNYHEKAVEILKNNEEAFQAIFYKGIEGSLTYMQKSVKLNGEWFKEIKRVYLEHGVPESALTAHVSVIKEIEKFKSYTESLDDYDENIRLAANSDFKMAANGFRKILEGSDSDYLKQGSKQWLSVLKDMENGSLDTVSAASLFKAQDLLNNMKCDEAIAEIKKAASFTPGYYFCYILLSDAHYLSGQRFYLQTGDIRGLTAPYKDVIEDLKKAIGMNPEYAGAYIRLSYFLHYLGEEEEAKKNMRKAIELMKLQNDFEEAEKIERFINKLDDKKEKDGPSVTKDSIYIDRPNYIFYMPKGVDLNKKYPTIVALSPNADARQMMELWQPVSDRYKWLVYASKTYQNGPPVQSFFPDIIEDIYSLHLEYPIDMSKIIAAGLSGGGMGAHLFAYFHSRAISAVIINTGIIYPMCKEITRTHPRGKLAVFLASPTDYRYKEMKEDKRFLDSMGWKTKWIEFKGGHIIAPASAYNEAARWLDKELS